MERLTETHNWVDSMTGLDCRLKPGGTRYTWCGYVRVPESHPLFGKHYNDDSVDLSVHGGVTFSDAWEEGTWWFGFDTAHLGDKWRPDSDGEFRDLAYCKGQCRYLAKQLAGIGKRNEK